MFWNFAQDGKARAHVLAALVIVCCGCKHRVRELPLAGLNLAVEFARRLA
jgi:hypothetical protein